MLLTFAIRLLTMPALATSARGVARVNNSHFNTRHLCLVGAKTPQLSESPVSHLPTHLFVKAVRSVSNPFQVFKSKCLLRCFGIFDQFLANAMIPVSYKPLLTFSRFLQATFGALRAALLQAPSMFPQLLPKCFDFFARVAFAFTGSRYLNDSEVNTQHIAFAIRWRLFYVARRQKEELAFNKAQITFPLARLKQRLLMFTADKRNLQTAFNCPNTHGVLREFVGQNPVVVSDACKRLEGALLLLVQFVGIGHFGDATHNDLSRKPKAFFGLRVSDFVKRVLPEDVLFPSQRRQKIASLIRLSHGSEKRLSRRFARLQLDLGNQLHAFKYGVSGKLLSSPMTIKRTAHSVYSLNYHLVFVTKYRNEVLTGSIETYVKERVRQLCMEYGFELLECEVMPDHLHLFVSAPPKVAPVRIAQILKSKLALSVFRHFPNLKKKRFWGSGL